MTDSALHPAGGPVATASAYSKINLTLDVFGRRDDGYHNLRSLVIGVDLADHLRCAITSDGGVKLRCSEATLAGSVNLVVRAAAAFGRHCGRRLDLRIDLEKRIPVGGGMGGGSSDAAATLRLCNHLLSAGLDRSTLSTIGAGVGSDVPLFFHLPAAVIAGRGESVEPVALKWSGWVLLAICSEAVSTADVYRAWRPADSKSMLRGLDAEAAAATTADELSAMLSNHLEPAVFRVSQAVEGAYETLRRLGCSTVRVSGAGSTLYQLFDERDAACRVAGEIERLGTGIRALVVAAPVGESPIVET